MPSAKGLWCKLSSYDLMSWHFKQTLCWVGNILRDETIFQGSSIVSEMLKSRWISYVIGEKYV